MQIDQILQAKGSGATGCLLNNSLEDRKDFQPLNLPFRVKELALSGSFVIATDQQDRLYVWGTLKDKILNKPLLVKEKALRISCGWQHSIFEDTQGLWGFGANGNIELGISTNEKYLENPMLIWKGKTTHFICSFRQSYIIADDNLLGCGQSRKFELGISEKKPSEWRIVFKNLSQTISSDIVQLSCGKRFLLMLTANGDVWAFGNNQQNCFDRFQVSHTVFPLLIHKQIEIISSGWAHVAFLQKKGNLQTFGRNNLGQLGREEGKAFSLKLQQGEKVKSVVSGSEYSFIITSLGRFFGWGWNEHANVSSCNSWSLPTPKFLPLKHPCSRVWTYPAITIIEYLLQ